MAKGTVKQHTRALLLKLYGARYERHWSSRNGCFYCGDSWTDLDHCPPLSWLDVKDYKWFIIKYNFYIIQHIDTFLSMILRINAMAA